MESQRKSQNYSFADQHREILAPSAAMSSRYHDCNTVAEFDIRIANQHLDRRREDLTAAI